MPATDPATIWSLCRRARPWRPPHPDLPPDAVAALRAAWASAVADWPRSTWRRRPDALDAWARWRWTVLAPRLESTGWIP
jgi:hypothetical protein